MNISSVGAFLVCASLASGAASAVTTTVVDVPSRGFLQRFLYVEPDAPVANIVHIPGGSGVFNIQNDGSIGLVAARCSPVSRTRDAFAERGYAVALVDKTSGGSVYNFEDVREVVRYMQARHNVPTWLIGGSSATAAIGEFSIGLPAGSPVGVIFYSPEDLHVSIASAITRPTLLIWAANDPASRPSMFTKLTSVPVKEALSLPGGSSGGCGYHLFQGLEDAFAAGVTGFIARYNDSFATAAVASAVEFHNAALDHYFLTHVEGEIAILDAGVAIKGWTRTTQSFAVYLAAQADSSPVCRYYIPPGKGDSHFYGRGTVECDATGRNNPSFANEDPQFFHVALPTDGVCPAGTSPVYRVFSGRADANHRYMVSRTIRDLMTAAGWLAEGDGADLVVMCSPQ